MKSIVIQDILALLAECKDPAVLQLLEMDGTYLKHAYESVEALWHAEYSKFCDIRLVLLAESPLFGERKSYIYNPVAGASAFLTYQDFTEVFGAYGVALPPAKRPVIEKKAALLDGLRNCSLIVLDLFPFALNDSTSTSYADLKATELFKATCEHFFRPKLATVLAKATPNALFVFRYERVRAACFEMVDRELERQKIDPARLVAESISGPYGVMLRDRIRAVYERTRPSSVTRNS